MNIVLVRSRLHDGLVPHACLVVRNRRWTVSVTMTVTPLPGADMKGWVDDEHLRAEMDEQDPRCLSVADVIVRATPLCEPFPGCLLTAMVGDGQERIIAPDEGWRIDAPLVGTAGTFASFLHTWMTCRRPVTSLHEASVRVPSGQWRPLVITRVL